MTTRTRVTLVRHDHVACPEGPRTMMNDENRTGCANGRTCPAPRPRGGIARATYYARIDRPGAKGKLEIKALYLCDRCARAFAHRYQITTTDTPAADA